MSRDDMYDLIIGAAVVTAAYMLWKQHKAAAAKPTAPTPGAAETTNSVYEDWLSKITVGVMY
jgi:hypothetical protein